MKAWFRLLYLHAALKLNTTDTEIVWYHESSNDIFPVTMQKKRFTFLTRLLQINDAGTCKERWNHDEFTAFREFFEAVNRSVLKLRKPSPHIVIDEILYSHHGRINFKQYNPSNSTKYGLLFRSLYDLMVQFTYILLPYAGNPTGMQDKSYVTNTDKYIEYLVNTAVEMGGKDCVKEGNISLNCYFTSMTIEEWCLEKNITITGTLKFPSKRIPMEMKEAAPKDGHVRESKSMKWCYNDKMALISYAHEKKTGTKVVLALTTMFVMRVSKDQSKKPDPLIYYDHMKRGIDVVDLVSISALMRTKMKRWTLNENFYLLHAERTKARTLYNKVNKKNLSNFNFTWQLDKMLVASFLAL